MIPLVLEQYLQQKMILTVKNELAELPKDWQY